MEFLKNIFTWWYIEMFWGQVSNNVIGKFKFLLRRFNLLDQLQENFISRNELSLLSNVFRYFYLLWAIIISILLVLPALIFSVIIFIIPIVPVIQFTRYVTL
jgi:hypothetical protein